MDSAREYLRAHRYPEHVVAGGLNYLLDGWDAVARSVAAGEVLFQDDYLNDMDGRCILAEMLPNLAPDQQHEAASRIATADALIRPHLISTAGCIWGSENERRHGYTRDFHWWYYHRPSTVDESWRDF